MAWEWSHTQEGLDSAKSNLECKDRKWLEVCFAENEGRQETVYGNISLVDSRYKEALSIAKKLSKDILVECIWDFAQDYRVCTNGDFELYMCPFGCHTVTCDKEG